MSICGVNNFEEYVEKLTDSQLDDLDTILCECFDSHTKHELFMDIIRSEKEERGYNC